MSKNKKVYLIVSIIIIIILIIIGIEFWVIRNKNITVLESNSDVYTNDLVNGVEDEFDKENIQNEEIKDNIEEKIEKIQEGKDEKAIELNETNNSKTRQTEKTKIQETKKEKVKEQINKPVDKIEEEKN